MSIIEGPPGTGKTAVLTAATYMARSQGKGVIVVSETNNSVRRIYNSMLKSTIINMNEVDMLVSNEFYAYNKNLYSNQINTKKQSEFKPIILCTLSKAIQLFPLGLSSYRTTQGQFEERSLMLIDEATMSSTLTFYQLLAVSRSLTNLVILGDPKQRQPFTSNKIKIESCFNLIVKIRTKLNSDIIKFTFLDTQYRMQWDVGNLISKVFYNSKVKNGKANNGQKNCYFKHLSSNMEVSNNSSYAPNESLAALKLYAKLNVQYPKASIVILTYYNAQIDNIQELNRRHMITRFCRAYTVDSYQGMESDIVIVCTCAYGSHVVEHVEDTPRCCVCLSRAKNKLYILGNKRTLWTSPLWLKILNCI